MFQTSQQKNWAKAVFGIYLVLLTWLILFKLGLDLGALPHRRAVNWIPYRESVTADGRWAISEIVYNILAFVPLGVYVHLFGRRWNFGLKILPGLCLSLFYEITQFAFAIGVTDITDVINNTLGGVLGLLIALLLCRLFKEKTVTVVNAIGLSMEAVSTVILAIVLIGLV